MAGHDLDQQLRQARVAYIAAVRRLDHAMKRFDGSGIPMDPGPRVDPLPWTPEQRTIIRAAAFAFAELLERWDEWAELRAGKPYRPPGAAPGRAAGGA